MKEQYYTCLTQDHLTQEIGQFSLLKKQIPIITIHSSSRVVFQKCMRISVKLYRKFQVVITRLEAVYNQTKKQNKGFNVKGILFENGNKKSPRRNTVLNFFVGGVLLIKFKQNFYSH
ncbi:MAG: hypothetical protein COB98_11445 [Flavobacteriaceae bacterium]|nr:MAG: hypothetical protein COB98_11445 [Flavobacteriaceae bacterium]